ncbi:MAG: hypothetical protein WA890_13425 [Micromonospora sp.]
MDEHLPFIDEHQVLVSAPAEAVWRSLTTHLTSRNGGAAALAHLLATEPRRAYGSALEQGTTVPGFAVAEAEPGRLVRLAGHHRFSRYTLTFTLLPRPDGTLLSARTDAAFPGVHGWVYRRLVISSGAHQVLTRRMIRTVGRHAERHSAG